MKDIKNKNSIYSQLRTHFKEITINTPNNEKQTTLYHHASHPLTPNQQPTTTVILTYNYRVVGYYEVDFTHPLATHCPPHEKRNPNLQQATNPAKVKSKL